MLVRLRSCHHIMTQSYMGGFLVLLDRENLSNTNPDYSRGYYMTGRLVNPLATRSRFL